MCVCVRMRVHACACVEEKVHQIIEGLIKCILEVTIKDTDFSIFFLFSPRPNAQEYGT